MSRILARDLPKHVGIIMDGNGRWATRRGEDRRAGHKAGSDAVRRVVRASRRLGIKTLTLYAFSEQNWSRPCSEVGALMGLLEEFLKSERGEILDNGIRLVAIGDLERLPEHVRTALDPLAVDSQTNDRMTLCLALSYGSREELASVARALAREASLGLLDPTKIDAEMLAQRMPSLHLGNPDLILRTGGEQRLSNFLLYGAAEAELIFSERLWPDFTTEDLFDSILVYQARLRERVRLEVSQSTADLALQAPRTSEPSLDGIGAITLQRDTLQRDVVQRDALQRGGPSGRAFMTPVASFDDRGAIALQRGGPSGSDTRSSLLPAAKGGIVL